MSAVAGRTIALVRAGYEGKRLQYERMAELGVRIVLLDEPGHWSESLVETGLAERWIPIAVTGNPDTDAAAVLDALARADVQPDGVLTIWEESTDVAARVALALGLPGNPPEAVDAARSKVRTRELCAELGLPSPRARRVRSLDELYAAAGTSASPPSSSRSSGGPRSGPSASTTSSRCRPSTRWCARSRAPKRMRSSGWATTCSWRSTWTASSSMSTS
jgi:hypothetical protein